MEFTARTKRRSWAATAVLVTGALWGAVPESEEPGSPVSGPPGASLEQQGVDGPGEGVGPVMVVRADSIVHVVLAEFLREALEEADRRKASALVIELNTPGGDLVATRQIFSSMLEAETPVVVFVSPRGSQAASAGFFLLMAADVAAMAPGTNTGAAHPVGPGGQEIEGSMGEKVEQDAAATIRSLAARNGRDQQLAEAAVLESRSFSAQEALDLGLVDLLVSDLDALLKELDGRLLEGKDEQPTLSVAQAPVERVEMPLFQRIRSALAHPNIAFMLMSLGGLGLFFELTHPGAIFPGVTGLILLILGLYGTSSLPVNYAGLALIALSAVLFLAEIKVQSFGLFTLGGLVSLVLGSLMLFDSPDPALRISLQLVIGLSVLTAALVGGLSTLAYRAHRGGVATGEQGLVDRVGRARSDLGPGTQSGKIDLHGEIWNAVCDEPVAAGQDVEVVKVDGLLVHVRPLRSSGQARPTLERPQMTET